MATDADTLIIDPANAEDPPNPDDQLDPNAAPAEEEVVFGDEAAPPADGDNAVIRHLREELKKANARAAAAPKPAVIELGPKPTLEGCEFDGDKFETELDAWKERERQAKDHQAKAGEPDQQLQQEWQRDHQSYQAQRAGLKFADVDEVESVATAVLSNAQQVAIVQACKNPALVLYALGKYPAKLAEISPITNPIKFGVAVADLERTLAVKSRSKAPNPEEIATDTASMSGGSSSAATKKLAAMEAAWEKTGGDRKPIIDFKRANGLR